ncbi:hypothetical protein [Bacillus pinisoli]|uniref:hypothetical protein n=1 Tax=Bacillus pinisoli TaxID=2901866 RepID=UPI001FF411CB|nr:hypothetical protein [Bacillus pinisoli]
MKKYLLIAITLLVSFLFVDSVTNQSEHSSQSLETKQDSIAFKEMTTSHPPEEEDELFRNLEFKTVEVEENSSLGYQTKKIISE